jgi:glycosyltransferase involved in cell wall biosynthesis
MKITFAINDFNFFLTHRYELLKLLSLQHTIYLLTDTSTASKMNLLKLNETNIKLVQIRSRKQKKFNKLSALKYIYNLRMEIKNISPDHKFYIGLETSFFGAIESLASKKTNISFVISGLGSDFHRSSLKFYILHKIYLICFFLLSIKKVPTFIFQNKDNQKDFSEKFHLLKYRSKVIAGNGIDINQYPYFSRDFKNGLNFLFAGRLVKSKGIGILAKAMEKIQSEFPKTKLIIAGGFDAGNNDSISPKEISNLKKKNFIEFVGSVPHQKMIEYYKRSSVFILLSDGEGLPKAALEAASTGMPLILSDVSGCRDCIHDNQNGKLVDHNDYLQIINTLTSFLKNPDALVKMSIKSRDIVKQNYGIKGISDEYLMHIQNN